MGSQQTEPIVVILKLERFKGQWKFNLFSKEKPTNSYKSLGSGHIYEAGILIKFANYSSNSLKTTFF